MSCLFQSIGKLIQKPHIHVRNEICNYMQQHLDDVHQGMTMRQWIQWQLQSPNAERYVQNMRNPSVWGGAMELTIATKVYGVDIVVVDGHRKQVTEFLWRDACTARKRLLVQWTGVHYDPIRVLYMG